MSRRHDSGQDNAEVKEELKDTDIVSAKQEGDKKADLDTKHERGSLGPDDVDELVRWVSRK